MIERWFSIFQGPQTRPLGLHRLVTIQEPSDMELLVPVGTWLVQTHISPDLWSPLETLDSYDIQSPLNPQPSWPSPALEKRSSEAPLRPADTNDARPRAIVYTSDAFNYDTPARAVSRDEANVDFFEEPTTWNV